MIIEKRTYWPPLFGGRRYRHSIPTAGNEAASFPSEHGEPTYGRLETGNVVVRTQGVDRSTRLQPRTRRRSIILRRKAIFMPKSSRVDKGDMYYFGDEVPNVPISARDLDLLPASFMFSLRSSQNFVDTPGRTRTSIHFYSICYDRRTTIGSLHHGSKV